MKNFATSTSDCSARSATWDAEGMDDEENAPVSERVLVPEVARGYLPALDGLRGIAILLVIVYHCAGLFEVSATSGLADVMGWRFFHGGWIGVDLFFVLSGFLITGILLESKSKPKYFSTFYARRTLRIFPLYYVMVIGTFILFPPLAAFLGSQSEAAASQLAELPPLEGKLWWYLLYGSNFLAAIEGNMGHRMLAVTWSLAIEEQFYLVWPFVIYLFRERISMVISCGMIVGAFAIRCGLVWAHREGWWEGDRIAIYVWPFCRMDSLAVGAVIAILWRKPEFREQLGRWSRRIFLIGTPLLVAVIAADRIGSRTGLIQTFGYSFLGIYFGAALILVLRCRPDTRMYRLLTQSLLLRFGKFAYAIYMFHVPIMFALYAGGFGKIFATKIAGSSIPILLVFTLAVTGLVFVAAQISWVLIERPFLRLKRLFPSESDKVTALREG